MNQSESISRRLFRVHTRHGAVFFVLFSLGILALSVLFFVLGITKPYIGVQLNKIGDEWVVGSVDPSGCAIEVGIEAGDIPVEINGQPAEDLLSDTRNPGNFQIY